MVVRHSSVSCGDTPPSPHQGVKKSAYAQAGTVPLSYSYKVLAAWPTYAEVREKGIGAFLHDPAGADPSRVFRH